MAFVHEHKPWTMQEWGRVFFTDEMYVIVGGSNLDDYVTWRPGKAYAPRKTKPMFTQPPTGVMIWACVALGKKGPIAVMEYPGGRGGGMNASCYQDQVLEHIFLPYTESLGSDKHDYMFQQDNAPGHKAKSMKEWFEHHGIIRKSARHVTLAFRHFWNLLAAASHTSKTGIGQDQPASACSSL